MKLDEILTNWKVDSQYDEINLDSEIFKTPSLHAKYLEQYVTFKAGLAATEKKINNLKYLKKRYFRGEMTKEELDRQGWSQYQGLKPSNTELKDMFEMDADIAELNEKLEYYKTGVGAIEYIMKTLNGRDYSIKSVIEYRKYLQGG